MIGESQAASFKAAILKQLPAGAGVYFTTMITEGVSYRFGNHWRASAAPISPTVAASAGKTHQGGSVWPPGQPADVKHGRLVLNTNVHGAVFNTAAGKAALAKFWDALRINSASVFPPRTFGRMVLSGGSGLRLVNDPTYPCTCQAPPPEPTEPQPTLTLAQAYGPNSATAAAAGASNVTWAKWRFTATNAAGVKLNQEADNPLAWWYNLAGNTAYTIRVVGITAAGKEVPGGNTLSIKTPQEGAATIAAANPTGPTTATVRLTPPTNNQAVSEYRIAACLKRAPASCIRQKSKSIQISLAGLEAGAAYTVTAQALVGGSPVPASNALPLFMPAQGAPVLLSAAATSAKTGAATAAAPAGTAFSQYAFTAKPLGGGASVTSTVTNPLAGQFSGLRPSTQYDVTVVGYKGGKPSPASNLLSFVTPAATAPLNTGEPKSPTTVVIRLVAPTAPPLRGGSWAQFDVTLCPMAGPQSACISRRVTAESNGRRLLAAQAFAAFDNRTPFTTYNFVSTAISQSGERSQQAVTAQVTTPGNFPPSIEVPTQSITPTGATAKISANAEGGPFTRFVVAVCPKPASGAPNWDKCPSTTCLLAQAAACPIGNLSPGRKYTVSAVAYTGDDTASGRSTAVHFTTQPWPAPTATVEAGKTTTSTASISVVAPSLAPSSGWSKYTLLACPTKPLGTCLPAQDCTPARAPPAATVCTVKGLAQDTTYSVRVRAEKDSVRSSYSASKSFTTLAPPVLLSATPLGPNSGYACVEVGAGWATLKCSSCFGSKCIAAPVCNITPAPARSLLGEATCKEGVLCNLGTALEGSTSYSVSCKAANPSSESPASNSKAMTTTQPPAPAVDSTGDPAVLQCLVPAEGGSWKACVLSLCKGAQGRRRLRAICSQPITRSCDFDAKGFAKCNLTGLVEQRFGYQVFSTAVKADGTRKSLTGEQSPYMLPYFPEPQLAAVFDGTKWTATITPNVQKPLVSYPAGGWAYYEIRARMPSTSGPPTIESKYCKAAISAGGVPQVTTCSFTLSGTPSNIIAIAWQGKQPPGRVATDLRSEDSNQVTPGDGPKLVSVHPAQQAAQVNTASVCVQPPTKNGPWLQLSCKACFKGQCVSSKTCAISTTRRRQLLGDSPCTDSVQCDFDNLESTTPYTVSCKALKAGNVPSPDSNSLDLQTEQAPAPPVEYETSNPTIATCMAPAVGGPWKTCFLVLCQGGEGRRRLRFDCPTPITKSCDFDSKGIAKCDLTGLVEQRYTYNVMSEAVKADDTRRSKPGIQGQYILPYYTEPQLAVTFDGTKWTATITPDVSTPLVSYPAGGWAYYEIQASMPSTSGPPTIESKYCEAAISAGGVPQPTTCQFTLSGTPSNIIAIAWQGKQPPGRVATDLRSEDSNLVRPQDGPTLVSLMGMPPEQVNEAHVCVQPPKEGTWEKFECKACYNGQCLAAKECDIAPLPVRRRLLEPDLPPCIDSTRCSWDNLESTTSYTVSCKATKTGGASTPDSNPMDLTTLPAKAPYWTTSSNDAVTIQCGLTAGGPWKQCKIELCPTSLIIDVRRRLQGVCSNPITKYCSYDNPVLPFASCDMTGLVEQVQSYQVFTTAIKEDGTRTSATDLARGDTFTVPLYPAPDVGLSNMQDLPTGVTYSIAVTPVTTSTSDYPEGGWAYYLITVMRGKTVDTFYCTAENDSSGAPIQKTCQFEFKTFVEGAVSVQGVKGDQSNPQPTDLRTLPSLPVSITVT